MLASPRPSTLLRIAVLGLTATSLAACSEETATTSTGGIGGTGGTGGTGGAAALVGPLGAQPGLPVDQQLALENLSAPVDVVRDQDGRPHIYASTVTDAMRAEGFMVALDRASQLEILRRTAEGRLAELAPSSFAQDVAARTIGLTRIAQAQLDAMPAGETRQILDAYADGVTQVFRKIRSGEVTVPEGIGAIPPEAFTDWTAVDSLAVTRFQTYLLSYDVDADLYFQRVLDSARGTFTAADPDPLLAARAGIERDLWQFAPADPASPMTGYPGAMKSSSSKRRAPGPKARPDRSALLGTVAGYLEAHRAIKDAIAPDGFGSNGWVLGPSLSATGHALLASDPHLQLALPAVFWPVSIEVLVPEGGDAAQAMKVAGVAFPGIPGVALGHNEHIAWGATVAGYDVADAYAETLTPDAKSVMLGGSPVPLTSVDEVIQIKGSDPYTYSVKIVPHHGPILPNLSGDTVTDPDPAVGAMSVRWTGLEPTEELAATLGLLRAGSASEAKSALAKFRVGAQNWMIADTAGDILWTSTADIPIRDPNAFAWSNATFTGNLPCLVLPGDGTAEWKGLLADDLVPGLASPGADYILTANADPIGDTADNDPSNGSLPDGTPMYLHCSFNIGFRQGRLRTLIEEHPGPFTPEELAALQADIRSPLGASITPRILDVIDRAEEERTTPGSHPELTAIVNDPAYDPARVTAARAALDAWGKEADFAATSGLDAATNTPLPADGAGPESIDARASRATLLFNVWLVRALRRTFADEYIKMGFPTFNRVVLAKAFLHLLSADPATLATFDPASQDSALWDDLGTPAVESRDEQMIRALLDTFAWFDDTVAGDPVKERWGAHHTVTFGSALPTVAKATFPPSDDPVFPGGFPRPGDEFVVDHAEFPLTFAGDGPPKFRFAAGAAQRLVVDLDPAGPRAWNALPGGAVWDPASSHYQDSTALWRHNQTHPVAFLLPDVIAVKESRTVLAAP